MEITKEFLHKRVLLKKKNINDFLDVYIHDIYDIEYFRFEILFQKDTTIVYDLMSNYVIVDTMVDYEYDKKKEPNAVDDLIKEINKARKKWEPLTEEDKLTTIPQYPNTNPYPYPYNPNTTNPAYPWWNQTIYCSDNTNSIEAHNTEGCKPTYKVKEGKNYGEFELELTKKSE